MAYRLFYWPQIQGRGEFVRLALEEADAEYIDVARRSGKGLGVAALMRLLGARNLTQPPFAPPFLQTGRQIIGQTANILLFLGGRHGLAPKDESARLWTHELQLTLADFLAHRLPRFLGYFERILGRQGGQRYLVGAKLTYVDLSMFQIMAGLSYAFPKAMARGGKGYKRLWALHDRVQERPRVAAYLASERRIPFNDMGIFRQYSELDVT